MLVQHHTFCFAFLPCQDFQVTLYNPLARSVQYATRIPVMGSTYSVFSPLGKVWADVSTSQNLG